MSIGYLFSSAFGIPSVFVEGNAIDNSVRYDVSIVGPKSEDAAILKALPDLLSIAFQVTAKRETRDTDGWAITAPKGKPEALKESPGTGGFSQRQRGSNGDLPLDIEGRRAEEWRETMIDIPYSLVIEATEDPEFFAFYSPELEGFTGVGHSLEDCLYKARWGIKDFVRTLKDLSLPVPQPNKNVTIVIQNERKREVA